MRPKIPEVPESSETSRPTKLSREHTVLKATKADMTAFTEVVRDQKEFKQVRVAADVGPM
ncbi:hypothetical protein [Hymenobacter psychrophilus]|uniref:Uncharacterized protein n=1 Tax=Hymenobacter psychrophilus TaxID=651662 RepID=A0A1H3FQX0_9BACT|nr:hypothetical protein [Hymenobacter psychrophilus]SDX93255.1 hypothetical protein SAMN04488069_104186 [Hymenobacter psychrophilus]